MFCRVTHAYFKQRRLQSFATHFRSRCRSAEKSYALMHYQRSRGAGCAVDLGQKAWAPFTRNQHHAGFSHEVFELRMLMRPAACVNVAPKLRLIEPDQTHSNVGCMHFCRRLNRAIQYAADLEGAVAARAK